MKLFGNIKSMNTEIQKNTEEECHLCHNIVVFSIIELHETTFSKCSKLMILTKELRRIKN